MVENIKRLIFEFKNIVGPRNLAKGQWLAFTHLVEENLNSYGTRYFKEKVLTKKSPKSVPFENIKQGYY